MLTYIGCFNKGDLAPEIVSMGISSPVTFFVDCIFFKQKLADVSSCEFSCIFFSTKHDGTPQLCVSLHNKNGALIKNTEPLADIRLLNCVPTLDVAEAVLSHNAVALWLRDHDWFKGREYGNINSKKINHKS